MKRASLVLLAAMLVLAQRRRSNAEGTFHTETPARTFDIVLGRPQEQSISATVLAYEDLDAYFEYADKSTVPARLRSGVPSTVVLDGLRSDTPYRYRLRYRKPGEGEFARSDEYAFHTRRKPGSAFTFAVQADSHLDENTDPAAYVKTLANMRAASPDFLVDLGDTFMTDKRREEFQASRPQYFAQRYYFGLLCHSAPLFLVLGNHDGEGGARHDGTRGSMGAWSHALRTSLFPNPRAGGIYSAPDMADPLLGPLESAYAFEWGDALFVALDPYWPTTRRAREDNWPWTLGDTQYRWLKSVLERSQSPFKFVFIHHPTGAKGQPIRGGIEAARYNEWGGRNEDGTDGFAARRAGWDMPVHNLLAKNGVSAVFHGHDHMYAREELGGVIYQEVPQPGNPRAREPRNAEEYGYLHGGVMGGSGHLRVRVTPQRASVEFVRIDGSIAHSYSIPRRTREGGQ